MVLGTGGKKRKRRENIREIGEERGEGKYKRNWEGGVGWGGRVELKEQLGGKFAFIFKVLPSLSLGAKQGKRIFSKFMFLSTSSKRSRKKRGAVKENET